MVTSKIKSSNQKKGLIQELLNYGRYFWRRSSIPEKKLVIFSRGHSESTLLIQLLNDHPYQLRNNCSIQDLISKIFLHTG